MTAEKRWGARRLQRALALALVLAALAGCSGDPEASSPDEANRRADLTVLGDSFLPAGWKAVPAKSRLDDPPGKPVYCGISVEPDPVLEGRLAYYEEASSGRAVLEYAMVGTAATARDVLDALLATAKDCRTAGRTLTVVTERPEVGDQSVAWDSVSDSGVRSRILVLRAGDTVVALIAFGATSVPETEQGSIAQSVTENLS